MDCVVCGVLRESVTPRATRAVAGRISKARTLASVSVSGEAGLPLGSAGSLSPLRSQAIDPLSNKKGIIGNRWQAVANMLFTMRCETVAVGCHRLPIGLFERFSGVSHLPLVATGCARWAP
jgi:hypothetical protein